MKSLHFLALISLLPATCVFADVSATWVMKTGHLMNGSTVEITKKEQLHGSRSREETRPRGKGGLQRAFDPLDDTIVIMALDTGLVYKLDLGNQVYEEIPLKNWVDYLARQSKHPMSMTPRFTHLRADFHMQISPDSKRINGFSCRKSIFEVAIQSENPENHTCQETRLINEIWTNASSPALQQLHHEEMRFRHTYLSKIGSPLTPEERQKFDAEQARQVTGLDEKELAETLGKATVAMEQMHGYPVRAHAEWFMRFYKDGKEILLPGMTSGKPIISVVTDLVTVNSHSLSPGLFRPPRDYNKIPTYTGSDVKRSED